MQEQIAQSLQNMYQQMIGGVIGAIPGILKGILIFIIGWLLATILSKITYKIIKTAKGDAITEKLHKVDLFKGLGVDVSTFFSKLVFWLMIMVTAIMASEQFGLASLTQGISAMIGYIPRLISALIFFVIGVLIANFIKEFIKNAMDSMNLSTGRFISNIVFYFIFILVAFASLEQAGINTSALVQNFQLLLAGILFALALGYGLSSRDLFANILGSVYSKGKFSVGQKIKFQDIEGTIIQLDSTSVILQTTDRKVVIPLAKFTTETVDILS